ncbi:site-specific DNA-methyltransferase [Microbispora sp. NPDC049633]|uniref:site-specific DNA-methyltransferase n=1 Tax=Microbispora sp. NPDC049633 TaxID=3154355 RepID=UPI00343801FA
MHTVAPHGQLTTVHTHANSRSSAMRGDEQAKNVRLELTWPQKDRFLLIPRDDSGKPVWVDRDHPSASEVRLADFTGSYGQVNDTNPYADNLLFTGDSLDVLRILCEVPEFRREYRGKIKLVYLDPPFNTGQAFAHYDDWMEHSTWLSFMRDRLLLIKELLAPDGSVWVHLDNAEVHRMRCLMDEIMGAGTFLNQVVWRRTQGKSSARRGLGTMCDTILVYGRTERSSLRPVLLPLTDKHLATEYRYSDERGRYMLGDLTAPGARTGDSGDLWRGRKPPGRNRHWAAPTVEGVTDGEAETLPTRQRLDLLDTAGYIHWPPGENSVPKFKRYLREDSGVAVGDLWDDIPRVANSSKERRGYDTQKPEALLQRILTMGTERGDVALDVFGGSGTTAAVAHKMGRRWITADISPMSVSQYMTSRLREVVDGADDAGISQQVTEVAATAELPAGTTADDFATAAKSLKAAADAGLFKLDSPELGDCLKLIERLGRKVKQTQVLWSGGGGFRSVTVSPSIYEVSPYGVLLADWATNGTFARAVAGQLGFDWQPDAAPFCGIRGRMRLAVIDGAVGSEELRHIIAALGEKERVTVVAKIVLPGAEQLLTELSRGSRLCKAPRDLLLDGVRRVLRREGV